MHGLSPAALHVLLAIARVVAAALCACAIGYYAYAVYAARSFFASGSPRGNGARPPITILKPIRGLDPEAYENFASFCRQRYPKFQIVFGAEGEDEAVAVARRVARDFPAVDVRILVGASRPAANPKVGNLAGMLPAAKHPLILVSDSDIRVDADHLERLARCLEDPGVGVATCLYRSEAIGFAGVLDALGLSTDFQPSVLVARRVEGITFGMGSGILIRRATLEKIGGFAPIADYLSDDYLLGNLPVRAGYRVELSDSVVEHRLATSTLRELAAHQLRWNRGILASRPGGYTGLILTQGTTAALALLLLSGGGLAAAALCGLTLAARLAMAWYVAVRCLRDSLARRFLWLVPLRDLVSSVFWLGAFFGKSVEWRGVRFGLRNGGRMRFLEALPVRPEPTAAPTSRAS